MTWMMYVATAGVGHELGLHWCPLSRLLYLLPWNREEPFDAGFPGGSFSPNPSRVGFVPPTASPDPGPRACIDGAAEHRPSQIGMTTERQPSSTWTWAKDRFG